MSNKLKVLVITNLFPNKKEPNRGIFIKQALIELAKLVDLQVVAPVPWFPFKSPLLKRWAVNAEINIEEKIDGITTYHPRWLVIPKFFRSLYGYLYYWSVKRTIKELRMGFPFDIIYAPWIYPDGFASTLLAKELKRPIVLHARGCDLNLYSKYFLRRQMIRWSLNAADMNIAVSKALADRMMELGVKQEKVIVVPNGVKNELFHPMDMNECRKKLSLNSDEKIVLFIGSLEEVKGVTYLIDAFQGLIGKNNGRIRLIMIGKGGMEVYLKKEIEKRKLSEKVTMVGEITHEEIPLWMNACDVFCLPSIREGMPNVLLEAMACGKTIVASAVGGIPEVIDTQECGILIKPADTVSLMKGLETAISKRLVNAIPIKTTSWQQNAESLRGILEAATLGFCVNRMPLIFRLKMRLASLLPKRIILMRGRPNARLIALTFDDGPNSEYTPQILNILRENNVKATFFLVGASIEKNKELPRRIIADSHMIGMHSFTHPAFTKIRARQIEDEIVKTKLLLKQEYGIDCNIFRSPGGAIRIAQMVYCARNNITTVIWSVEGGDEKFTYSDILVNNVTGNSVKGGDIVLLHDDNKYAVEALPKIINRLKQKGFEFVTIEEMLK